MRYEDWWYGIEDRDYDLNKDYSVGFPDCRNLDEICLIQEFFKREQEKPASLRATSCLISCPCKKCNSTRI